jgi:hypothetical protein
VKAAVAAALLACCLPVWAQSAPAVREQQRQAEQARKQHPKSAPPAQPRASLKAPGDKQAILPRSKPGQAAIKAP